MHHWRIGAADTTWGAAGAVFVGASVAIGRALFTSANSATPPRRKTTNSASRIAQAPERDGSGDAAKALVADGTVDERGARALRLRHAIGSRVSLAACRLDDEGVVDEGVVARGGEPRVVAVAREGILFAVGSEREHQRAEP